MRARSDLRTAQNALIREMTEVAGGIAVLGMGGGKTASALTAFLDLKLAGHVDHAIVLAPPRVVANVWPNEPPKWEHLDGVLDVVAVEGPPRRRERIMSENHDVYVVSINNVKWLVEHLNKLWPGPLGRLVMFVDEISKLKSPTSKWAKELMKLTPKLNGCWGLTGTPKPDGYEDLFSPIRVVSGRKDAWGPPSITALRREYFRPLDYHGYNWAPHPFAIPHLEAVCKEWLVYAPTDDLELPALLTGDDFVEHVQLTDEQRGHYDDLVKEMVTEVGVAWRDEQAADEDMYLIQALSQGALSAKLVQVVQGYLYHEGGKDWTNLPSPKLDRLKEADDDLGDDKAVIVYGLRAEIPDLTLMFGARGRSVGLLGGGVSSKRATETIDAWNAGEVDRLLVHPASAGHGVELQFGGRHMIHYHPTWSAEGYDQIIKRLHRPGQTQDVVNYWLMADGTIDELKYARVERKLEDQEAFRQILRRIT